jgi:hypothetical protein
MLEKGRESRSRRLIGSIAVDREDKLAGEAVILPVCAQSELLDVIFA